MGRCSNRGSGPRSSPVRGAWRPLPRRPSSAPAARARGHRRTASRRRRQAQPREPCGRAGHDRSCARGPVVRDRRTSGHRPGRGRPPRYRAAPQPPRRATSATPQGGPSVSAARGRGSQLYDASHQATHSGVVRAIAALRTQRARRASASPTTACTALRRRRANPRSRRRPAATSERSRSVGRASAMVRGLVGSRGGGMRRGHPRVGVASSKVCPATSYSPTTSRLQYHRR